MLSETVIFVIGPVLAAAHSVAYLSGGLQIGDTLRLQSVHLQKLYQRRHVAHV